MRDKMCAVNDRKRAEYNELITQLEEECTNEINKLQDIEFAKKEVHELINEAQCAIDNLSECDLGTDGILNAVKISQKGYYNKSDYYDEYMIKCKAAIEAIKLEKANMIRVRDALPKNCGSCSECCPPEPSIESTNRAYRNIATSNFKSKYK